MKKVKGQHPGETRLTDKEQEEWMTGPRGLQITHRGDSVTFTLFFRCQAAESAEPNARSPADSLLRSPP